MAEAALEQTPPAAVTPGRLMSAMDVLVELPMEQRRRDLAADLNTAGFISGYRGSPLGTYDQSLWRAEKALREHHVHFQPGVNEDLAATAVMGTQQSQVFPDSRYDGIFSIWYSKGPGVDRSGDALRHGNLFGTSPHGGVLLAVGDDPVCHSSTAIQQSERILASLCIPVLHAADAQDIYDFGLLGWAMSRYAGLWVGLKMVTDVAESSGMVSLAPERGSFVLPPDFAMPEGGIHFRWPDWPTEMDARMEHYRLPALRAFVAANGLDRVALAGPRKRLGIITSGKSYGDVRRALQDLGLEAQQAADIGIGIYKLALVWPLETEGLTRFAEQYDDLIVIEEGRAHIEPQVKDALYALPELRRPRLTGKRDEKGAEQFQSYGELIPRQIARVIARRIEPFYQSEQISAYLKRIDAIESRPPGAGAAFPRTPYFCSGCPHNTSTRVPEGSVAAAGIGCHFMAVWMERNTLTYTQMGGEGVPWAGLGHFSDMPHIFVNLGDGTFYHSGSMAIRQAVAAGVNVTYKILYNDAVAMTGGQPVDGPISVVQIAQLMAGESIRRIAVVSDHPEKFIPAEFPEFVTFHHRDDLDAVQRELRQYKGVSILIYEQTCATEKRRRRKRGLLEDPAKRVLINDRVCEGCGDCGVQSNCLSVLPKETEFGRKRQIDQSACNKDYSCVKGFCPSFVTVHGGELRRPKGATVDEQLFADLPRPAQPELNEQRPVYAMLLGGIGGTGVVTVSKILAHAAMLDGLAVRSLDDAGMAQKFGAVYSNLQVAIDPAAIHTARIASDSTDLLLGPDLVTSAGEKVLPLLRAGHTHAIVNSYEQVTGAFTRDPDSRVPKGPLEQTIADICGQDRTEFINTTELARQLTGDAIGANMLLLGFACQRGLIPASVESIEQAIRDNGTAVNANLLVFRLGRLAAHAPEKIDALLIDRQAAADEPPVKTLQEIVALRVDDLTDYQNAALAARYRAFVDRVAAAEKEKTPGRNGLAEAVARYYYKLLAVKDEYEVGRLYSNGEFQRSIETTFSGDYELHFHMAPPLLARRDPTTGRPRKMEFGPWMKPVLGLLARLRGLRGTPLDVFGYTAERKAERAWIGRYEQAIDQALAHLDQESHALVVEIASVPEQIRGFGYVKEEKMAAAQQRLQDLLNNLKRPNADQAAA